MSARSCWWFEKMRVLQASLVWLVLTAQTLPPEVERGIAEIKAEVALSGDSLWPGLAQAPFGFLFVDGEHELLVGDERTPPGFVRSENSPHAVGPRSWRQPAFLAAMPAFGPPSVIVMGTPEATGQSYHNWRRTIIHEHFHQWQAALPRYYQRVEALGLAHGDATGMWMLNYAFPYARADVVAAYRRAAALLAIAATTIDQNEVRAATRDYLAARRAFRATVTAEEWRYYDFQLWQEGVARWTEIRLALDSNDVELKVAGSLLRHVTFVALNSDDLAAKGRESVYAMGAAEAILLDRIDPDWRGCYRVSLGLDPCWDSLEMALEAN